MTTEELLEQLEAEAQSETPVCVIDPETRTITVPPEYQLLGVENDKRVERIYFQCPKIVGDNQDLSQDYILFINYVNANGDPDAYKISDMQVEGDNITFSWLLEENVTKYRGNIQFAFGAIIPGDEAEDPDKNRWNTTINTDCTCLVGLKCTQQVAESNPDALAQIWATIDELKAGGGGGTGGTTNYENLSNKPQLNGVTLEGNKTLDQVGVLAKNQGSSNSGKYLSVGSDGNVVPTDAPSGGTVDPEQIKQAVNGYLEENPPSGMTAEEKEQLDKNTENISSLSEDIENIKNEGVPIKDKTITPEKTTFILTEQQENIVTEVTRYANHPAAVVENGISSGTTIYYNIAGINSLNIFDSGTGGWVSANISEYGTNSPYESNESGAKGKFTVTKNIPKCLFYGSAVWTWENPVINTTGVFFDGAKITGISNEFLDALKTESDEIVKSGLENESGIITPEMTDFVNLNFMPIGKLDYSSPQMFYAVYLEKDKIYYCKSPGLLLYPSTNWVSNTPTPATQTGNGGFTIGNLETGTYYVKLDYIADADDRESYAKSYSDWVYSVPIGDNFVVNIGDYDLIPESDPVKRKIMEFTCDLVGKTWNALGDSNTQYPGGYQMWQSASGQRGYVQYIGDKYYMSAKNNGTGGATWGTANSANAVNKVDSLVSDGVKWDIVTFSFGTNADTSMGTYESTSADKTSLAGAMRYCIETMQANFPLTKLGVILPTRRSDGNLSNDVLKQRCELMTAIAHDYGVPVCDMFNESGTITSWYSDGLHICNPGSWSMDKPACYHYESKLEKFLLSL